MEYKKLYKVSLSLSKLGLNWKIKEFESYETEKTIVMVINDPHIEHAQKKIHKSTLNKFSDKFIPSTTFIANSMFCYEEDLEKSKQRLYTFVMLYANKFKTDIDQLYIHIVNDITTQKVELINHISRSITDERAFILNQESR